MRRLTILAAALGLAATASSSAAQSVQPDATSARERAPDRADLIYAIKTLQAQVTLLQEQLNSRLGDPRMQLYADAAYGERGAAWIVGWAFKCGPTPTVIDFPPNPDYTIDVIADGLPVAYRAVFHVDRPDVTAYFAEYCQPEGMPDYTGIYIHVNLRHFAAGWHTLNVRIKDRRGAVVTSNDVRALIR